MSERDQAPQPKAQSGPARELSAVEVLVLTDLFAILTPLHRRLVQLGLRTIFLWLLVILPFTALAMCAYWQRGERWWGLGFVCAIAGWFLIDEMLNFPRSRAVRRARQEFDRQFPEGSTSRELAIQLMTELEFPGQIEEKLLEAIRQQTPTDRTQEPTQPLP